MIKESASKILIVEDEIIIAEYIADLLEEEHFTKIRIANNKEIAVQEMTAFLPDIILMDINLKGVNSGIELSKAKNDSAVVIFITGQHDVTSMNEALQTNPDAYLTKPLKKVDVLASIRLAIYKRKMQTFQFKDGYDTVNLKHSDIRYFVADGNYVTIQTTSRKYIVRQSLIALEEKLSSDLFIKSHRSYIVNKSKVERVTSNSVVVNGLEIPLSRTYAKYFK
ncbi:response regulator transcription factor [Bizionia gelidisalsuginis]|uniref:Response regulator transcription factor n=2 Tax=Bizionia TaxID=283785 RepID=A0A8H2QIA2_9FLAO|nr:MULTISPECIES: response regulator transcription factor [Bizionia]TYB69430.1 response regulator transcription factor [Bizionia saleffrena]TYC08830.1 response regulator transcription factor [Bizionia gelidisalsuginis]